MALVTYAEAIVQAHREEMQRDPTVFALGTDIAQYGGSFKTTKDLWKEFGLERLLNTPISEGGITGAALGAALAAPDSGVLRAKALLADPHRPDGAGWLLQVAGGRWQVTPAVVRGPGRLVLIGLKGMKSLPALAGVEATNPPDA